jgi:NADPH:quinone reductase-like Zn-dependent oxidoreductase
MRAVVCPKYGPPDVLEVTELVRPDPRDDEVRIKIHATTAHVGDTRIRAFRVPAAAWLPARIMLGFTRPRRSVLGMELAGVIDVVGEDVQRLAVGDEVMASPGFAFGAYAEYICLPEDGRDGKRGVVAHKPASLDFGEAAPLTGGGLTALLVLRKADIQPGHKVLIYGASGSVGTYAVQLARHHFGADVTAVCSTANLDLVRSLGADTVIDYTCEDFTEQGESYDVVFDAVDKLQRSHARKALAEGGTYLNVDSSSNGLKLRVEDLELLGELADAGKLRTVVDRRYPLEQIVEAHRYVDQGHKKGNVIVTVGQGG